ncbi:hypothetical protein JL720_1220 [Aureococcus anophagefferens]|nr:hypothetical protein JL720_1220 [Aureococcus anophagefferens]
MVRATCLEAPTASSPANQTAGDEVVALQLAGCNSDCGRVEATVVCAALGFPSAASASAAFGGGRGAGPVAFAEPCGGGGAVGGLCAAVRHGRGVAAPAGVSCRAGRAAPRRSRRRANSSPPGRRRRAPTFVERRTGPAAANPFDAGNLGAYVFGDALAGAWAASRARVAGRLGGALGRLVAAGDVRAALGVSVDRGRRRGAARAAYLADDPNGQFHWELDGPLPPPADPLGAALARDGVAVVDDWGFGDVALGLRGEKACAGRRRRFSPTFSRAALRAAVESHLGADAALDGYKVTRLTTRGEDEGAYIAGLWHHDRVGRRLKLFVYLHGVDCGDGHPALVARTHRLRYYRTDSFAASRFEDAYVRGAYDVVAACGRRGGGFLFDTHAVHKGTPEGARDRTTVIAEFHSAAKCPALEALGLGLPCPSGDQYLATALPTGGLRRYVRERAKAQATLEARAAQDLYFTQRLDHFDGSVNGTFQQRYFLNATYFTEDGPVFLCVGGRGPALDASVLYHSVALEHRYYGRSVPPSAERGARRLRHLSSQQAVGDIAAFHGFVAEMMNLTSANKWVTFGGSYPGMLGPRA